MSTSVTIKDGIEHRVAQGGMYCSCTLDAVTCQGCGTTVCGTLASWLEATESNTKGNHCAVCVQRIHEGEDVSEIVDESMSEDDFSHEMTKLLRAAWEKSSTRALSVRDIESYSSAGMLTSDEGLVVTLKSGEVFHLTIKRAR